MGECIQCGMCCMVSLCPFGEAVESGPTGECGHLIIDTEGNVVCTCDEALEHYIGSGCIFMEDGRQDLYLLHLNEYLIEERKAALEEECYGPRPQVTQRLTDGQGYQEDSA